MTGDDVDFETADVALLRAALLPLPRDSAADLELSHSAPAAARAGSAASGDTRCPCEADVWDEPDRLRARIGQFVSDPAFLAAVELASPSLAGEARKASEGRPAKTKRLRRVLVSLVKYRLRMTYRPTPFGLFAGVALAEFGATPSLSGSGLHRTVSRPDAAWLEGVLRTLDELPEVADGTRLVANELCTERDGRLMLVDAHDHTGSKRLAHSVRLTAPVRRALEIAAAPLARTDLVARLADEFPQAPDGAVERCVAQLVRGGFLLSDLAPPPDCADPLAHVRARVDGVDHDVPRALKVIGTAMDALDSAPRGAWGPALAAVTERMRAVHDSENVVQIDTVLDTRLILPTAVRDEVERTATALWRTSLMPPGSPSLREYHGRFLERYGTDRLIPVLELLDPARGLGLPEAYTRRTPPEPATHPAAQRRDRILAEVFLAATRRGADGAGRITEVALDGEALRALSLAPADGEEPRQPPASLELGAEVVAKSVQDLWDGRFRLVLGTNPGSPLAGATFSRFAWALGKGAERVRDVVRGGQQPGPGPGADGAAGASGDSGAPGTAPAVLPPLPAVVAYRPRSIRSANVALVPQWLDHRIPLGVGPAATEGVTDLRLEGLAVGADLEGLHLVDISTGRRVRPVSYSMLNPLSGHVPHVARFLLELGQEGQEWCPPWNWGKWSDAPAQPRVTYGRSVLSPARWIPDRALTEAAGRPDRAWRGQVARWRRRWDVPRHVLLARLDNRVAVDLEEPLHLLAFQDELRRGPGLAVLEQFGGAHGRRWLVGPDGAHACEFVFPVFRKGSRQSEAARARPLAAQTPVAQAAPASASVPASPHGVRPPQLIAERSAMAHVPGGEWLYTKVYVPEELQPRLLAEHLGALTEPGLLDAADTDSWFFLRYADPDPHLRIRFHGRPTGLWSVLLPELRRWTERLRKAGFAGRLILDTYDPEIERYGGPSAIALAECAFHTDSATVVAQLGGTRNRAEALPATMSAALGVLAALTGLGSADEALAWLGDPALLERRTEVTREQKRLVAGFLDELGHPVVPPAWARAVPSLGALWEARDVSLASLRKALSTTESGRDQRPSVAMSLAHMHCNRLLGPRREDELLAHAAAREGLALRLDRTRHGR
ncbi:lantibiotic dehydratase [Streptomyces sp. NRRL S-31]|uniref:lantibiotic dehydratase n=1 Tax=Streptomyces sp. NRRL S-31 TaxID=1463898 RepID=UPI0004C64F4D|nr:lantibiotic dehydratase [Streptomyces sp. NRRL S-31]